MQGQTDAFFLLDGEGNVQNQYLTDYEEFILNAQSTEIKVGANQSNGFYAVAPSDATADVNVNIIEEA